LDEALTERADDAPPAGVGAERDREAADEDDPDGQTVLFDVPRSERPVGDQRAGDDAHRRLRAAGSVRGRHGRGRAGLAPWEGGRAVLAAAALRAPVGEPGPHGGGRTADRRPEERRQAVLRRDAGPARARRAGSGAGGTEGAAGEGAGRA